MTFNQVGASIECEGSKIIARRFNRGYLEEVPNLGTVIKYKCDRNGTAEITRELNPKKPKYNKNSHLNIGDKLAANKFFFYVPSYFRLKLSRISRHTHTHGSQEANTRKYTYAQIERRYYTIPELQNVKVKLLEEKTDKES
ncbi:hypothetical protein ACFLSA_00830 [Bacteroidota bacterium]